MTPLYNHQFNNSNKEHQRMPKPLDYWVTRYSQALKVLLSASPTDYLLIKKREKPPSE